VTLLGLLIEIFGITFGSAIAVTVSFSTTFSSAETWVLVCVSVVLGSNLGLLTGIGVIPFALK